MTENEYYDESIRRIEKNIDCFVNRLSAKSLNNCETILNTMRDDVRNAAEAKSDSMYKYISDDKAVSFEYNVDLINCEKVMAEMKVKKDNETVSVPLSFSTLELDRTSGTTFGRILWEQYMTVKYLYDDKDSLVSALERFFKKGFHKRARYANWDFDILESVNADTENFFSFGIYHISDHRFVAKITQRKDFLYENKPVFVLETNKGEDNVRAFIRPILLKHGKIMQTSERLTDNEEKTLINKYKNNCEIITSPDKVGISELDFYRLLYHEQFGAMEYLTRLADIYVRSCAERIYKPSLEVFCAVHGEKYRQVYERSTEKFAVEAEYSHQMDFMAYSQIIKKLEIIYGIESLKIPDVISRWK